MPHPTDHLQTLTRHRWARHILRTLATHGPQRYSDLLRTLGALDEGPVHSKSLSAALPYLHHTGLITHTTNHHERRYTITNFGKGLLPHLNAVEHYLTSHQPDPETTRLGLTGKTDTASKCAAHHVPDSGPRYRTLTRTAATVRGQTGVK